MRWNFWKKTNSQGGGSGTVTPKLAKPKDLPEAVGRKMVVNMKMDPDVVWSLKFVSRPMGDRRGTSEFRIFDPEMSHLIGLDVKNWTSLNDHPDLIIFSGHYDKSTKHVEIH